MKMKIKNASNTLWKFEINKFLIILFTVTLAVGLIVASQVIKAQADVSADGKTVDVELSKTAQWTDNSKENIDVTINAKVNTTSVAPNVLFLGTLCDAHTGDMEGTLYKSLKSLAKVSNVDYYAYGNSNASTDSRKKVSGHVDCGTTLTKNPFSGHTYTNNHFAAGRFVETLYNLLITNNKSYDYIIFEFDVTDSAKGILNVNNYGSAQNEYAGGGTTYDNANPTKSTTIKYETAVANKLITYYSANKVIWVSNDTDIVASKTFPASKWGYLRVSSCLYCPSKYSEVKTKEGTISESQDIASVPSTYNINGTCESQISYKDADTLCNYLDSKIYVPYELQIKDKIISDKEVEILKDDLGQPKVSIQYYDDATNTWLDFEDSYTATISADNTLEFSTDKFKNSQDVKITIHCTDTGYFKWSKDEGTVQKSPNDGPAYAKVIMSDESASKEATADATLPTEFNFETKNKVETSFNLPSGGTVETENPKFVSDGSSANVQLKLADGFKIDDVKDNGVSVKDKLSYVTTAGLYSYNIDDINSSGSVAPENHSIIITVSDTSNVVLTYSIPDEQSGMGTIDNTSETVSQSAASATGCTATANTGYHFVQWTWTDSSGNTKTSTNAKLEPEKDEVTGTWCSTTYTASFAPDTGITYYEKHKFQSLSDPSVYVEDTNYSQTYTNGVFGTEFTPTAKSVTGFTAKSPHSIIISTNSEENVAYIEYDRVTDIEYTIKLLYQDIDDESSFTEDADARVVGTAFFGQAISYTPSAKDGFTTPEKLNFNISVSENTYEVKYYRLRNIKYVFQYLMQSLDDSEIYVENTILTTTHNDGVFGKEITFEPDFIDGFTCITESLTKTLTTNESDNVFSAKFDRQSYGYTIQTYLQNDEREDYVLDSETPGTAKFGSTVTPEAGTIEGYTYKSVVPCTISSDESKNIAKIYYDKNSGVPYTIKYYFQGASDLSVYTVDENFTQNGNGNDGQTINAEDISASVPGFEPKEASMPSMTLSSTGTNQLYVYYNRVSGLSYEVRHMRQKVDLSGYDLYETTTVRNESYYGQSVIPAAKDYEGFSCKAPIEPITIGLVNAANIAYVYYDRNIVSYSIEHRFQNIEDDNYTTDTGKTQTFTDGYFGQTITPSALTIEGFDNTNEVPVVLGVAAEDNVAYVTYDRTLLGYTIKHMFKDVGANTYTENTSLLDSGTAKYAATINPTSKTVNGFVYERNTPVTLSVAGPNVAYVYYTRTAGISYTVKYQLQNTDLSSYSYDNSLEYSGTAEFGSTVVPEDKSIDGFVKISYNTVIVDTDESKNICIVKYDRVTNLNYEIHYLFQNVLLNNYKEDPNHPKDTGMGFYGQEITPSTSAVKGFTVSEIMPVTLGTNEEANVAYVYYNRQQNIPYIVKYMFQDTSLTNYVENEDMQTGGTGFYQQTILPTEIPVEGFNCVRIESCVLDVDSNAENIAYLYYDRNAYNFNIKYLNQSSEEVAPAVDDTVYYGQDYRYESPVIEGMVADKPVIEGIMQANNQAITVTYTVIPTTIQALFSAGYGAFPDGDITKELVENIGSNYVLPSENPVLENCDFIGWFTDLEGGEQITTDSVVGDLDIALYARYKEKGHDDPQPTPTPSPNPPSADSVNGQASQVNSQSAQTNDFTSVVVISLVILSLISLIVVCYKKVRTYRS